MTMYLIIKEILLTVKYILSSCTYCLNGLVIVMILVMTYWHYNWVCLLQQVQETDGMYNVGHRHW